MKRILFSSWLRRRVFPRAFVSSNLTTKLNQSTQSTSYTGAILSNQVDTSFEFPPTLHSYFFPTTQVQHPPGGGARRPLQHLLLSAHSNIFLHLCRLRPPGFHIVSVSEAFYQHIFICLYSLPAGGLSECLVPYKVRVEDTMSQFK